MKKHKNIVFLIILLCGLALTAGCGKRGKMSAEEFVAHMEKHGFETSTLPKGYGWTPVECDYKWRHDVQTKTVAWKEQPRVRIEFFVWETEEKAMEWFEDCCRWAEISDRFKIIEKQKKDDKVRLVIQEEQGYSSEERYVVLSRVENTTVYVRGSISGRKEIKEVLKGMDY